MITPFKDLLHRVAYASVFPQCKYIGAQAGGDLCFGQCRWRVHHGHHDRFSTKRAYQNDGGDEIVLPHRLVFMKTRKSVRLTSDRGPALKALIIEGACHFRNPT